MGILTADRDRAPGGGKVGDRLADNVRRVRERIGEACARAGRDSAEVTLVAVTKTVGFDTVARLLDMQVFQLGESRVQELARKAALAREYVERRRRETASEVVRPPDWHMIGHLQRNKVKALLSHTSLIHSVDSLRLAEEIDQQAGRLGRVAEVLLEINAGLEPQKHGIPVGAATHLAEQLTSLESLRLVGVMTMAPFDADEPGLRACFTRLAELFQEIRAEVVRRPDFRHLSMGMSRDFEIAVECGATMVRVGTALFEGVDAG